MERKNTDQSIQGNSKLLKISESIDKFYKSQYSLIVFISLSIIATILQITLFLTGKISVNFINHGDGGEWVVWFVTTIALISSTCMLTSNVLVQRENKNFIYFSLISLTLSIINLIATRVYLVGFTQIITVFLVIQRYMIWKKMDKNHSMGQAPKKASRKTILVISLISLTYLFALLIVIGLWGEQIYDPQGNGFKPEWTWWLDGIGAATIIASMLFINFKCKIGFIFQCIGPITGLIIMAQAGQYIMTINLLILATMAFTSYLSWIARDIRIKQENEISE